MTRKNNREVDFADFGQGQLQRLRLALPYTGASYAEFIIVSTMHGVDEVLGAAREERRKQTLEEWRREIENERRRVNDGRT